VHASLIVVLTREGSTARLVAKYRPLVPVLTVAVPVLTTGAARGCFPAARPWAQRRVGLHASSSVTAEARVVAWGGAARPPWPAVRAPSLSPRPRAPACAAADSLTWTCSGEAPARQCLVTRGLIPVLAEGSARATDSDTTDEILAAAIEHAKRMRYCAKGDSIVALHRIGNASVIKIIDVRSEWRGGQGLRFSCVGRALWVLLMRRRGDVCFLRQLRHAQTRERRRGASRREA
jgi:hypothetical protein